MLCNNVYCIPSLFVARISGLEDEVRQVRHALSKAEAEKRQLQEKLTDLEKVNRHFYILYVIPSHIKGYILKA